MAHSNPVIRRMARNATLNFLKNAEVTLNQTSTGSGDKGTTSEELQSEIKKNEDENKVLDKAKKEVERLEKQQQGLNS